MANYFAAAAGSSSLRSEGKTSRANMVMLFLVRSRGEAAQLEQAEQVADAEALDVFLEAIADGGGAADDGVGPLLYLFAGADVG